VTDLAALDVPLAHRVELLVRVEFPDGTTDEIPVDNKWIAVLSALALTRDYSALAHVDVTATAVRQTWVLADETEITDPSPGDDRP
jgi:hypothetical protein